MIKWFVEAVQGFIMWEIGVVTSDMDSMVLWMSAFNVFVLAFAAMAFWGGQKFKPIVSITAVAMIIISVVTVALVQGT